jgi:hypothetical protein
VLREHLAFCIAQLAASSSTAENADADADADADAADVNADIYIDPDTNTDAPITGGNGVDDNNHTDEETADVSDEQGGERLVDREATEVVSQVERKHYDGNASTRDEPREHTGTGAPAAAVAAMPPQWSADTGLMLHRQSEGREDYERSDAHAGGEPAASEDGVQAAVATGWARDYEGMMDTDGDARNDEAREGAGDLVEGSTWHATEAEGGAGEP